ncbi:MAG: sulfite exporter TauE/SafE family protein [Alphaproteobacteria bacterium]|nr:sulfite exporter TauE/SafE family protein [Alphaproteobacteria bacterium]
MFETLALLLTPSVVLAMALAAFAGVLRGFSGFGSAMILAPTLSALFPITEAVPLVILLEVALSFQLLPAAMRLVERREIVVLSAAAVPGLLAGAALLAVAPTRALRLGISTIILLFLVLILLRVRRSGPKTTVGLGAAGVLSGVANGASGVGGPPIVLYYLAGDDRSAALRATVICYFFVIDATSAGIYGAQGFVTREVLMLTLLCVPLSIGGVWLGSRLFDKASEQTYRRVAYGLIAAVAVLGPFL